MMLRRARIAACLCGSSFLGAGLLAAAPEPLAEPARVEARSANLMAVGIVRGDEMIIRVSRIVDNSPLTDAQLTLTIRSQTLLATALADGSFSVSTPKLGLPGSAAVTIGVTAGGTVEKLTGNLQIAPKPGASPDRGGARQFWWWVLNFAVCAGFLFLFSRRRKAAAQNPQD